MDFKPTPIERAFELAQSGECAGVADIRERLRKEGHSTNHITGPSLLRQLRDICLVTPSVPKPQA
ncbi:hypothetical protein [Phenylobacterium sp.]|uniref:hypothetical protein n=1 Tax=Phenylobacterium sp. TaxID=1871053 RepID=UPI002F4075D5